MTKCKWEKEETKVKNGSSVSNGPEQRAGNVISSHKRKSRFENKIKPGCVNTNHMFSELQFTKSCPDVIPTDPSTIEVPRGCPCRNV